MKPTIINPRDASFSNNTPLIIDTNIWIKIHDSVGSINPRYDYSDIYEKILIHNVPIFITSAICSEYINVAQRNGFTAWGKSNDHNTNHKLSYKQDYRNNPLSDFDEVNSTAWSTLTNDILSISTIVELKTDDVNAALMLAQNSQVDFNDALIITYAKKHFCSILSDDKDFKDYDLDYTLYTLR